LRFACDDIYLILFTSVEIIEITSINVDVKFWFPCFEILFEEIPGVNINASFACSESHNIGDLACCEVGFDVLGNDRGGGVRKRSGNEENVKLHVD